MRIVLVCAAALVLAGCQMMMHRMLPNPGKDAIVRVESGDRLFFNLPREEGHEWRVEVDDSDVDVSIDPEGEEALVQLHVHRGYDGPSVLRFSYHERGSSRELKHFTLSLFRRTGDTAFWK